MTQNPKLRCQNKDDFFFILPNVHSYRKLETLML